ncbi:hypothetical protein DY000_02022284 [Brassica cretica]|uniref:Uncharacterized protein n=1 Tax=Brassica cretica TaxID=69181 RepID=A0ABQ7EH35_BRACR|nr:hypothetical protein DY000_02022284 [Brassica cretica]
MAGHPSRATKQRDFRHRRRRNLDDSPGPSRSTRLKERNCPTEKLVLPARGSQNLQQEGQNQNLSARRLVPTTNSADNWETHPGWEGPYKIIEVRGAGAYRLQDAKESSMHHGNSKVTSFRAVECEIPIGTGSGLT